VVAAHRAALQRDKTHHPCPSPQGRGCPDSIGTGEGLVVRTSVGSHDEFAPSIRRGSSILEKPTARRTLAVATTAPAVAPVSSSRKVGCRRATRGKLARLQLGLGVLGECGDHGPQQGIN
jgi:hypothetical protein